MGKKKASKKERDTVRLRKGELSADDIYNKLHKNDVPDSVDDRVDYRKSLHIGCDCYVEGFGFGVVLAFEEGIVYCVFIQFSPVSIGLNEDVVLFAYPEGYRSH